MIFILIPLYLVLIYCAGSLVRPVTNQARKLEFDEACTNSGIGFALILLAVHLFSFATQNTQVSTLVVFGAIIILSLVFRSRIKLINFDLNSLLVGLFALVVALCLGYKDMKFGNPDNFHIPLTASISENQFYPPIYPSTHDTDMSHYHYGVDLIGAIFKHVFGLPIWEVHSLQIFFCVLLTLLTMYALINSFVKQAKLSVALTVFVTFYTSINSLDFLLRELTRISKYSLVDFLASWLLMSWTAVSHMTSQLRLPSQNSAFVFAFVALTLITQYFASKDKQIRPDFFAIMLCAFGIYFTFPAFFYPIFASVGLGLLWELLLSYKNKKLSTKSKNIFLILVCALAGKILTFTGDPANLNGVKTLIFAPSFHWYHWGKIYIQYFYDKAYLSTLGTGFDYVYPSYHPHIPLFSTITLREFGFSGLIGLSVFIYFAIKKKLDASCLLILSGLVSMMIPLLFEFLPRPIETTRFLHWTKAAFVIYLAIQLPFLFNLRFATSKVVLLICRSLILMLICVSLIPGLVSIIPIKNFVITNDNSVNANDQMLIAEMAKLHKSGEVCLENTEFKHGHGIPELAGFFGVGGQIYKADQLTRRTAIYLLNPLLLQELKVDYILINSQDQVSAQGQERLKNSEYFAHLPLQASGYGLYKFLAKAKSVEQVQDYSWTLACNLANKLNFVQNPQGQYLLFTTRLQAQQAREIYRQQIKGDNPICAFWLKEEAINLPSL